MEPWNHGTVERKKISNRFQAAITDTLQKVNGLNIGRSDYVNGFGRKYRKFIQG